MPFRVLGPLEVVVDGQQVPLSGVTQRRTLAFLVLHANAVVPTRRLVQALWGDEPPATARKVLQNAISGLRTVLRRGAPGVAELATQAPGYVLRLDPDDVDLLRFLALAERGRAELTAGRREAAATILSEALALWRGPALADLAEGGVDWPELAASQAARLPRWKTGPRRGSPAATPVAWSPSWSRWWPARARRGSGCAAS